ncbi:unnamed protein product, partial [Ectocarpus sp. 12 AP-2014]
PRKIRDGLNEYLTRNSHSTSSIVQQVPSLYEVRLLPWKKGPYSMATRPSAE